MRVRCCVVAACAVLMSGIVPAAINIEELDPEGSRTVTTLNDIHYWVGEGTNRCGIVIDWSNGGGGTLAWGYRWNGTCTNVAEVVARIAHDDPRLKQGVQLMTAEFLDLYFFGYDVNDNHPQWDMESFGDSSDKEAYYLREDSVYYSAWWVFYGPMNGENFPTAPQVSSWKAANEVIPQDKDWFVFSWGCPETDELWNEFPAVLAQPEWAESPYGYQVVASSTEATNSDYSNPQNVLGHPSACMDDPSVYSGDVFWGGVVNPANPAWGTGRLFTLSSYGSEDLAPGEDDGPGYVTIKFDHDVIDDPANPFGLDFIVFGNSFATGRNGANYNPGTDPTKYVFDGKGASEQAKVEVSQDGKTWYSSPRWQLADDFAPTLGHLYRPNFPDPFLFSGNNYWGRTTQATRPVDPRVGFSNLEGKTLAQVCQYYNGSAGGTGYDLSVLDDLPVNVQGRKWIRYVRVSGVFGVEKLEWDDDEGMFVPTGDFGYSEPEVDAVADVAPVSAYEKWVEANYTDWTTAWKSEVTGSGAIAANGLANGVNYILGLSATETADGASFSIADFSPGELDHVITLVSTVAIKDGCGIVVKQAETLKGPWVSELPLILSSEAGVDGRFVTTLRVSNQGKFVKLSLRAD